MGVLSAGELDRLVSLYHATLTRNTSNGEKVATYPAPAYAAPYAKRVDLKGTKRLIAQQTVSQQQIEYTIRYRSDVLSTDRLVNEDGVAFEIMQIAQLGRREGLCLLCRTVLQ